MPSSYPQLITLPKKVYHRHGDYSMQKKTPTRESTSSKMIVKPAFLAEILPLSSKDTLKKPVSI